MAEFFNKFRAETTEEYRRKISRRIEETYTEYLPVLLDLAFEVPESKIASISEEEASQSASKTGQVGTGPLSTHKCLAPQNLTVGQFAHMMKTKFLRPGVLDDQSTLCILAKVHRGEHDRGQVVALATGSTLMQIHSMHASSDGFLYLLFARENVFGGV